MADVKSENIITVPILQRVNPIRRCICINLDGKHLPVTITKDNINYDIEDFINMMIDKKLNAEVESNNPCSGCQEFDCTYCEYNQMRSTE